MEIADSHKPLTIVIAVPKAIFPHRMFEQRINRGSPFFLGKRTREQ